MEFTCSCHTAMKIETICMKAEENGYAQCARHIASIDGKSSNLSKQKRGFYTEKYLMGFDEREIDFDINVKKKVDPVLLQFDPIVKVPIKIWYDRRYPEPDRGKEDNGKIRNDRAGIKITDEGLMYILKSMTVIAMLQKASILITQEGCIDLDSLMEAFASIINKIEMDNNQQH